MKKMSQSTEQMWPIGPVIACALSDKRCSCNQPLQHSGHSVGVYAVGSDSFSEHPVHGHIDLDRCQCPALRVQSSNILLTI